MAKMEFTFLFGLILALLSIAIKVHGQSVDISTTPLQDPQQNTSSATADAPESTSISDSSPAADTTSSGMFPSTTEDPLLTECTTPTDLKIYCSNLLTSQEMDFFQNDTSIMGVLAKVLTPKIVYALQDQCTPGNWCLADSYQKEISEGRINFYSTPICQSDNLWMCLENIEIKRRQCNESELFFLMSAIGLMCDMEAIDGGAISSACYTRSQEALHVLYADFSRNLQDADKTNECSNYNKQMTNTYACAVYACNLEQRVFLEDFGPWSRISSIAESVLETCFVDVKCPGGDPTQSVPATGSSQSQNPSSEPIPDAEKTPDDKGVSEDAPLDEELAELEAAMAEEEMIEELEEELAEMTTPSYYEYTTNENTAQQPFDNEQGMDVPESTADVDKTFVYGMATVTVVVVISLTLIGVMIFKRFSRLRKNYKLGYSQMTEEESRMLRNEYN